MLNIDRIEAAAQDMGFTVKKKPCECRDISLEGSIKTDRGHMSFFCIQEGGRIRKPNGSTKFYYGVSDAQFIRVLRQTIEANTIVKH